MIDADGGLERYDVRTSDPVVHDGGSGLMGLALAEDFGDTGNAYIYYTYAADSELMNRIAEVNYDGTAWGETRVLLDDIPGHQLGGRLAIGPDMNLCANAGWVTTTTIPRTSTTWPGRSSG
ncbi:PQQ-dependent sugar dehydrogenase [Streptomyces sp. NPDC051105]|uniref:PQQ-dependent sugar dehydrogenase n=1 Tax=Streptomyces sp. NPDC051105 TaxID=3154843 RepID=UPI003423C72E